MAQKYTMRARRALGYAMKEVREDAGWSTEEMGAACGSSGAAISSWERAKSVPSSTKRPGIDTGCEWPPGTAQRFLDGEIHTRDEIHQKPNRGKAGNYIPSPDPSEVPELADVPVDYTQEEPAKPYKGSYINPSVTERAEAAKSLAALLQKAMEQSEPAKLDHDIVVGIPQDWDEDEALRVLEAVTKLAQDAIDAYAKQRP
jgi:transcriptional regulator with XRE-family HTH domain